MTRSSFDQRIIPGALVLLQRGAHIGDALEWLENFEDPKKSDALLLNNSRRLKAKALAIFFEKTPCPCCETAYYKLLLGGQIIWMSDRGNDPIKLKFYG